MKIAKLVRLVSVHITKYELHIISADRREIIINNNKTKGEFISNGIIKASSELWWSNAMSYERMLSKKKFESWWHR